MPGAAAASSYRRAYENQRALVENPPPIYPDEMRRAQIVTCGKALGVDDARELLAMLGILPDEDGTVGIVTPEDVRHRPKSVDDEDQGMEYL